MCSFESQTQYCRRWWIFCSLHVNVYLDVDDDANHADDPRSISLSLSLVLCLFCWVIIIIMEEEVVCYGSIIYRHVTYICSNIDATRRRRCARASSKKRAREREREREHRKCCFCGDPLIDCATVSRWRMFFHLFIFHFYCHFVFDACLWLKVICVKCNATMRTHWIVPSMCAL